MFGGTRWTEDRPEWLGCSVTVVVVKGGSPERPADTNQLIRLQHCDGVIAVAGLSLPALVDWAVKSARSGARAVALLGIFDESLCRRAFALIDRVDPGGLLVNHPVQELSRDRDDVHFVHLGTSDVLGRQERLFTLGGGDSSMNPGVVSMPSTTIGCTAKLIELREGLDRSRLLTVHGPPGAGKSHLIRRLVTEVEDGFRDGAALINLESIAGREAVVPTLLNALELVQLPGEDGITSMVNSLRRRQMLIAIDNIEKAEAEVVRVVGAIVRECDDIALVIGARSPLHIGNEQRFLMEGLEFPVGVEDWRVIREFDSVALFEERARLVDHQFMVDRNNAGKVAQICEFLGGNPFAIELAASWAKIRSPDNILNRLRDRVPLRDADQIRNYDELLDLACQNLSETARHLLWSLSIFRGEFSLDWAVSVCAPCDLEAAEIDVAALELLDRSLMFRSPSKSNQRLFRMNGLTRTFAEQRLRSSPYGRKVVEAYRQWSSQLAQDAYGSLHGPDRALWCDIFDAAFPDIVQGIDAGCNSTETMEVALKTALSCCTYLLDRGHYASCFQLAKRVVEHKVPKGPIRSRIMNSASAAAYFLKDPGECRRYALLSVRATKNAEPQFKGGSYCALGMSYQLEDQYPEAYESYKTSSEFLRQAGDKVRLSGVLSNLVSAALHIGDEALIEPAVRQALEVAKESTHPSFLANIYASVFNDFLNRGESRRALETAVRGLEVVADIQDPSPASRLAFNCALALIELGNLDEAAQALGFAHTLHERYQFHLSSEQTAARRSVAEAVKAELGGDRFDPLFAGMEGASIHDLLDIVKVIV